MSDNGHLSKALSDRHIQFIALGGAIGASLFVGSGQGISMAGPGILLAFLIAGAAVYLMSRAMGEMILANPDSPTFAALVDRYVGRWAGFVSGWSYWLIWALVGVLEATAIGLVCKYWYPGLPQWIPALTALLLLYAINRLAVRLFGEFEFWLTSIKIVTIVILIVGGAAMAALHLGPDGQEADIANLWNDGGFFPFGLAGCLAALPLAVFAFGGTELLGVTAAETADPRRSIPRAVNGVIFRILFFYIGSLAVIMMVANWRSLSPDISPFVLVFERAGFAYAAAVVNFVVLTAIVSSLNSGIFATGRMLYSLALLGDAPAPLAYLDRRQLPANGINLSMVVMLAGVSFNYIFPEQVFGFLVSVVAALLLLTWSLIIFAHLRFRRTGESDAGFAMPFFPWSNRLALGFYAGIAALLCLDPGSRATVYSFAVWVTIISLAYVVRHWRGKIQE
ncbi:AAT family amino acid transporter/D-serine/D-alanine/glycine transporter [Sphingopyxis panaciterrae]|uniref:amino acid permease n=1 Tax=Sphingopyxis panaciterrae TaxID=363841 RepID=UPI001422CB7F|nr:amino acid permease [Sphingopyxis panaciterrae]NIJ37704.1 AAT family amino acid transporter/D-serine/D-alanine/glycine transporter [Sphingopyxis panaciterrae]